MNSMLPLMWDVSAEMLSFHRCLMATDFLSRTATTFCQNGSSEKK